MSTKTTVSCGCDAHKVVPRHPAPETIDAALNPCPFCGGDDLEIINTHTPSFWVECVDCNARVPGGYVKGPRRDDRFHYEACPDGSKFEATYDELYPEYQKAFRSAVLAWNTRASRPEAQISGQAPEAFDAALNDAAWKFVESVPSDQLSPWLFSNIKPVLKASIEKWLSAQSERKADDVLPPGWQEAGEAYEERQARLAQRAALTPPAKVCGDERENAPKWQRAGLTGHEVSQIAEAYFHDGDTERGDIVAAIKQALCAVADRAALSANGGDSNVPDLPPMPDNVIADMQVTIERLKMWAKGEAYYVPANGYDDPEVKKATISDVKKSAGHLAKRLEESCFALLDFLSAIDQVRAAISATTSAGDA